jgi:membrane protease subunit HflK
MMKAEISSEENRYGTGLKALIKLMNYSFTGLSIIITLLIIWYLTFAGYFTVSPQEAVLVLRFGKVINEFREGWHWTYPPPIGKLVKIPTTKQIIKTRSFWHRTNVKGFDNLSRPDGWPLDPRFDGYVMTGDANIIHVEWELVYEISDPKKYFKTLLCSPVPSDDDESFKDPKNGQALGTRGAKTTLKALLDNAVVNVSSSWNVDDALYKNSSEYNRQIAAFFIKKLAELDFGINISSAEINLIGKTAPLKTTLAFQSVIEAEQEMSKDIHNAREYSVKKQNEADAEKSDTIARARVYRSRTVSQIESEDIYFKKILGEYRKNPDIVILSLYTAGIGEFYSQIKNKFFIPKGENQELRIMLNPEPKIEQKEQEEKK